MRGLEEACIIHSAEDYAQALYFKEFLKWTGISYFGCAYNELDESLNNTLLEKENRFHFILYIGEKADGWMDKFSCLSGINIKVKAEEIWDGNGQLKMSILTDVWRQIFNRIAPGNSEILFAFTELIKLYCKYDVLRKLLNNKYSLFMYAKTADYEEIKQQEYIPMQTEWENLLTELEDLERKIGEREDCGLEYIKYADVYCRRKINELCNLREKRRIYRTSDILTQIDDIYKYDLLFYMLESLKSHIVSIDPEYDALMIPYIKNCVEICKVDASNSFHYYRLGKKYEIINRKSEAARIFAISYEKNRLNFRSLFKLAVDRIFNEDIKQAKKYLFGILTILQLYDGMDFCLDNLKRLPPLELEYASKCFVLLGDIEFGENKRMAAIYYQKIEAVVSAAEESDFLKKMYPEIKNREEEREIFIVENLKMHLTKRFVAQKLEAIRQRRQR